ncbi:MAG TPA: hypothetical protein DEO84_08050 [candidate division Zixibacteria bacterium]|nr:hypothetical protein [candidate division Zixibacteria bacterium]
MPHIPKALLFQKRGYWWINYSLNGERHRISTGTKDRGLAEIKRKDFELKFFKGEIGARPEAPPKSSLAAFFRKYIEFISSDSQIDRHPDLARLNSLQGYFARKGIHYIDEINPGLIDDFRTTVLAGKKPKTIKNYIMLLKTALNKAVSWELIKVNPIAKVSAPKIVKTFHFFSQAEIDLMISKAQEPLKTAILILVNTGMRRGELFHLRWRDVDLNRGSLRVWPYEGFSPKGKQPRRIPITDALSETLKRLSKGRGPDDFVFRPFEGPNTIYRHFAALAKQLGIKGTLHDLRHTFASHLSMAGVPIPVIKELLGHSDIATTMIYAHLSPEIHMAAIQKLPFGWCPDGAQNAPKLPKITPNKPSKAKRKTP